MATAFRTVSEEVSWTDWSSPDDRPGLSRETGKRFRVGHAFALLIGAALLVGVFYFVPPGSY
jgi:hypothetical protein